jgi:hypothetical protein
MKRMLVMMVVAAALVACGKGGEGGGDKAAEPDFTPGKSVEVKASGAGVTVQAPDNLEAVEGPDKTTLSAPGFPTITITKEKNASGGTGRMKSSGSSGVKVRMDTAESTWKCTSPPAGKHKDLVVAICDSMQPPHNPHFIPPSCDQAEGVEKGKVEAILRDKQDALKACFDLEMKTAKAFSGGTFSFSMSRTAGSTSTSHSMMLESQKAEDCVRDLRGEIGKAPYLVEAGDFKISCKMVFSLY